MGPDLGSGIAVDSAGNAFVAGFATSSTLPTTPGAFLSVPQGGGAFVTKLNPSGTALVYSTFVGPALNSEISPHPAIAVDSSGNAYLTGTTRGAFPVTPGSLQTTLANDVSEIGR